MPDHSQRPHPVAGKGQAGKTELKAYGGGVGGVLSQSKGPTGITALQKLGSLFEKPSNEGGTVLYLNQSPELQMPEKCLMEVQLRTGFLSLRVKNVKREFCNHWEPRSPKSYIQKSTKSRSSHVVMSKDDNSIGRDIGYGATQNSYPPGTQSLTAW